MSDEHVPGLELVMPFVATEDNGGTYNSRGFVAGWECGHIDAVLRSLATTGGMFERWVHPDLVAQLDLIAMHHGWRTEAKTWDDEPDEWGCV